MAWVIIPVALFVIAWFIYMHHGTGLSDFFVTFVLIGQTLNPLIITYFILAFRLELGEDFLSFETGYRSACIERERIIGYSIRPRGGHMDLYLYLVGGVKDSVKIPLPCTADEAFYTWLRSSPNYSRPEQAGVDLPCDRPLQTYMASRQEKIQECATFACGLLALLFAAYLFLSTGYVSMLLLAVLGVFALLWVYFGWMSYGRLKCCLELHVDHMSFRAALRSGSIPRDEIVGYSTEPGPGYVKLHVKRRDANSETCVIPIYGQFDQTLLDWLAQSTGQAGEGPPA
ncbi:hypothetical protein [Uliginosibacterium gangwonense]|uniref:hypothetical protein n=1 Tax=Uliginosibacterium gangwonense TaxID=392736 RepID=UPI00036A9899|nr:hypothetical protein [Uliginosibacterium gangwonense]